MAKVTLFFLKIILIDYQAVTHFNEFFLSQHLFCITFRITFV